MTAARDPRPSSRPLVAAMVLLAVVSVGLQAARDRGWQPYEPATPVLWLQPGPLTRPLALGFDELAADVYWMRAVVYYGGKRLSAARGGNYDLLYPLLDLATTLDPRFKVAYRFGAIFLTEAYPNGPGRPDLAIALLTRALERNPGDWTYMQDIGFIYYWWLNDYRS
ncbi:MAG: hypothetical protein AB7N90_18295, partial [Vicinamibacterales bacterium]